MHLHCCENQHRQMISSLLSWRPAERYYVVSMLQIRRRLFFLSMFWIKIKEKKTCRWILGQFYWNWLNDFAYLVNGSCLDLFKWAEGLNPLFPAEQNLPHVSGICWSVYNFDSVKYFSTETYQYFGIKELLGPKGGPNNKNSFGFHLVALLFQP